MEYIFITLVTLACISCRKTIHETEAGRNGNTESNAIIVDPFMPQKVKAMVAPEESSLPARPYTLVEYINLQRGI
ncbi:MAG: hypothetical protein JNK79_03205 [Chitinophagaceae bacterium]|nr:hypothetical protein [Chitinophagaceae bacterium]